MIAGAAHGDLDIRSLRYFVAVAEELHFTRAAQRMFIAQQALSREVQRLERRIGTPLFVRSTRRVMLTPEGERLLVRARELIALHDEIVGEASGPARPILVDVMSEGRRTGERILEAARAAVPELEFRGRHAGGMGTSIRQLRTADLDVALGRADWRGPQSAAGLERERVRLEPLALLLPDTHPLARRKAIPVHELKGSVVDVNAANPEANEWFDIVDQFLALTGAEGTPPHVPAIGLGDQAHHLAQQGLPILTAIDHVPVSGGVIVQLVDPVPLYAWSLVWRAGVHRYALTAIREVARALASQNGWLDRPRHHWLPEPEASESPS